MLLILLLSNVFSQHAVAQETKHKHGCKLVCHVFDAKTKEALPQATVELVSHKKGEVTNASGTAELKLGKECICTCQLKVSFIGYKDFSTKFLVKTDTSINIYLNEDAELLETVTVEGEKVATELNTLTVNKVNKEDLLKHQGGSITNAMTEISGVNALKSGSSHIAKPIIHGLYGNRILVQYNGVRLEGQQWGIEHAPELDGFLAEELAVVKGAASVQYGAEAMGGVVLVNPADLPTEGPIGGKVNLAGMSNGRTLSGSIMLEGIIGKQDGWGWRLQSSAKRGGDLHAPNYQLTNTGVQELNYSLAIGKKGNNWGTELFFSRFSTKLGVLSATGSIGSLDDLKFAFNNGTPQATKPFSFDINNPRQEVQHDLLKAKFYREYSFGRIDVQYALQMNKRKEFDIRRGALNDIASMNLDMQTHALDVSLTHKLSNQLDGNIGINTSYQRNRNIFGTQRSNFIPNFTSPSFGIYLIERWSKNKLQLEGGLRFDFKQYDIRGWHVVEDNYFDEFKAQSLTANFGVLYQLSTSSTVSTNIGTAWRPPHVAELYSFGKHQSNGSNELGLLWTQENNRSQILSFASQDIQNESSVKWVGTYVYATEKTQAEITAYANWIQNYIYLRPQGIDFNSRTGILPLFAYVQGNAFFKGIDININHQLGSNWLWQLQGSYLRAIDTDNKDSEFPFIPSNRVASGIQYKLPTLGKLTDLFVKTSFMHIFEQNNAPRVLSIDDLEALKATDTQPFDTDSRNFDFLTAPEGYTLVNVEAGFKIELAKSELNLKLGVQNLFNTTYRDYTNRLRYFADDLGRNISLNLQYAF